MGKAPAFQFYPGDWIQDTRILTPVTRGIWIDMLCFMWRSEARGSLSGTIEQLARMLSCNASEITHAVHELSVTKIADVTECNDFVTVTNRRMAREEKVRKQTLSRVKKFRNANEKRESNGPVTPPSSSSSSKKDILSSVQEVIEHLNAKSGKKFNPKTKSTVGHINARLSEGFTVDDFKHVINVKCEQWLKDPSMNKFIRPDTLFAGKFEAYRNEQPITKAPSW